MKFYFKTICLFTSLIFLMSCGGPALIDMTSASFNESTGTNDNGTANLGLTSATASYNCEDINNNVQYYSSFDSMDITVFGTDDSNTYNIVVYLAIQSPSTLQAGDSVTITNGNLIGQIALQDADDNTTNGTFYSLNSGSVEFEEICIDSEDCQNSGSFVVLATIEDEEFTIEGNFDSSALTIN